VEYVKSSNIIIAYTLGVGGFILNDLLSHAGSILFWKI